jgi:hypothetical protein
MKTNIEKIYKKELITREYDKYKSIMLSEKELKELSSIIISKTDNLKEFIFNLLTDLSKEYPLSKEFDWNIGSTIQHFDPETVISAFRQFKSVSNLYESIGLTWVFGEFNIRDTKVIEYLKNTVYLSKNDKSWWRAAFTLEKMGLAEAVPMLKKSLTIEGVKSLDYYFNNLDNQRSIIGILLHSNSEIIQNIIFPKLKRYYLNTTNNSELINISWLLGRYKFIDKEISKKMIDLIELNTEYEVTYYTFNSIIETHSSVFKELFFKNVNNADALIRKMAIRGLSYIKDSRVLLKLEELLIVESNPNIISELTKSLYRIRNPITIEKESLKKRHSTIENGLIVDVSDKWYADPEIYEIFSFREDPENIAFKVIVDYLRIINHNITNPVDIASGTGKLLRYFINEISFIGSFTAIDKSEKMIDYLEKLLQRTHKYIYDITLIKEDLKNFKLKNKSSLIMSSFGFPSKISNKKNSLEELNNIYENLTEDGLFITVGWDESFNDDLNYYWYKYIPDSIKANDFESWRKRRTSNINSPRNTFLTWYKKGITVPLQFKNLNESAYIMGHLFGRDAAKHIIEKNKTEWNMSIGITINTKEELKKILQK